MLDKIEALDLCAEHWYWLAANPGKYKDEWPRFEELAADAKYSCFACEYSKQTDAEFCISPCIVPIFRGGHRKCVNDRESPYAKWSEIMFSGLITYTCDKELINNSKSVLAVSAGLIADSAKQEADRLRGERQVTCFYFCKECDKPINPIFVDTAPQCPECGAVPVVES